MLIKAVEESTSMLNFRRKNAFDEWKVFCGFDTTRSITDLSKDESSIKDMMDMLSSFVLQVAKRMVACISQLSNFYICMFSI